MTYVLNLTLDDVVEVMNALADRDLKLGQRDDDFTNTLCSVRLQLINQGVEWDLAKEILNDIPKR